MYKILLFILFSMFNTYIFFNTGDFFYVFFVWNMILAIIPFLLIKNSKKISSKILKVINFLVSFLFWPNTIYLATDFIHLSSEKFYFRENKYSGVTYIQDIFVWLKLMSLIVGFLVGAWLFATCLKYYKEELKLNGRLEKIYVFIMCIISSIGIYMGRFIRFNSWDVLNPVNIIIGLYKNLNNFSIIFILCFSVFSYIVYRFYEYVSKGPDAKA